MKPVRRAWMSFAVAAAACLALKRNGLVISIQNICNPPPLNFNASFGGWNGGTKNATVAATVQGCPG